MNHTTIKMFKLAGLGLSLILLPACSQSSASKDPQEVAEEANDDKFKKEAERDADRLNEVYIAGLYEIKASENANLRATTAEVKKLAEMMIEAHTKMNADIEGLAARKNITLATDMGDDLNKKMEKLLEKNGLTYDKEYAEQMRERHQEAIQSVEKMAEHSNDAEIKQWAGSSGPQVRAHLATIESTIDLIKEVKQEDRKAKKEHNSFDNSDSDVHDGKSHTGSR